MGWSIGYDGTWDRDIGYGVPAMCDHPTCSEKIDRGLSYVCGGEPYGGERGCGLYFCGNHRGVNDLCGRCHANRESWPKKPDLPEWMQHKLTDESWAQWRAEHSEETVALRQALARAADASNVGNAPKD